MTEKRILAIHRSVCIAAGRIVLPAIGERWKAALLRFTKEEVLAAITAWRAQQEPAQGSLVGKRKSRDLPDPADLKAWILEERRKAYAQSKAVAKRRLEIDEFWRVADERGFTEQEIREKWPSYVGTRPKAEENAA
jgi:hypothetical protein